MTTDHILDRIAKFTTCETGSVTVDWTILTAGVCSIGLLVSLAVETGARAASTDTAAALSDGGIVFRSANFGRTPQDAVAALEFEFLNQAHADQILSTLATRTDTQIRDQHGIWRSRVADQAFGNPGLARDTLAIFEVELAARGLLPHA